jgi:membrane fusion protein (multidrug efflux system)
VVVRAELPNPERLLKPGLLMTVEFLTNPREAVVVPEGALLPSGRNSFVMVAAPSPTDPTKVFAERREVTTGSRREGEVEVLKGLEAGEMVVSHGGFKIADGSPLRIPAKEEKTLPDAAAIAPPIPN